MPADSAHAAAYQALCDHQRETAKLASILGLLEWDERTKMPPAGGEYRAEQIAYLAGEIHKRRTSPQVGQWLDQLADSPLAADPHGDAGTVIRELRRDYDKKTKLPQALVEELSRTSVIGQQTWVESRKADDFQKFQPILEKTLRLKRQEAAALGFDKSPYEPLLDDYEPGAKVSEVSATLAGLRDALTPLVHQIVGSGRRPDSAILKRDFPVAAQEAFGREAAAAIGFDFSAGRLDVTDHPFCGGAGPRDVRITTRYDKNDFGDAFFSILHEAGHGLYEQGLPAEHYGLPTGEAASLGIHESQSRMWENQVGRSREFWELFLPKAQQAFSSLAGVSLDGFYAAINEVKPSLIRVDADEVTYNLHILVRFELEKAMIEDDLRAADLPAAWNEKYQQYLGVQPPSDADGVLQDVHWSAGLFGYFPTYSLGNLYAGQFFAQAASDLGDLHAMFRRGEFRPLLDWLRQQIHRHGQRWSAAELAVKVTGKQLSHAAWFAQIRAKYGELYGL
ncbi:MAG: carboxypeptidase M32 [Planctomycetota bacterium]|nr:MAG: carboxypeptidase M32 [Planctomycetota bacterium]